MLTSSENNNKVMSSDKDQLMFTIDPQFPLKYLNFTISVLRREQATNQKYV